VCLRRRGDCFDLSGSQTCRVVHVGGEVERGSGSVCVLLIFGYVGSFWRQFNMHEFCLPSGVDCVMICVEGSFMLSISVVGWNNYYAVLSSYLFSVVELLFVRMLYCAVFTFLFIVKEYC